MRSSGWATAGLVTALVVVGAVAACSGTADPAETAEPERWGYWAVFSTDEQAGVDALTKGRADGQDGAALWTRHHLAATRLAAGTSLTADEVDRLTPGLQLRLIVEPGDETDDQATVRPIRFDALVVCSGRVRHQGGILDPAAVGADGMIEYRGSDLRWEADLGGSRRIGGTWSAAGCGGTWEGDDTGTGPLDGGWTRFVAEPTLAEPWYLIDRWGIELTTIGRRSADSRHLCLEVELDLATDLQGWLELQFGRGGSAPGDVVLDCDREQRASLLVDGEVERTVASDFLSGHTVIYEVLVAVQGTATLRADGLAPLVATFAGSHRAYVAVDEYENPETWARFDRTALACGLSPMFAAWWGIDTSYPVPVVHPFFDPPSCVAPDPTVP